jgi:competence protein ComEC
MTGAGASVVRAAVMGILLLAANSSGRWYDPRNSILLAASVMVFLDPLSLRYDVGFQLSFLAVLGLLYIYSVLEAKFKKIPAAKGLKETLLMSLAAQIAVAPLLAYVFHTFSIVSLPANMLILPLMPYTMLFAFLAGVGGMIFWALGRAIGVFALLLSWYQLGVIKWMAALPFSALTVTIPTVYIWLLYIFIILGTVIYFRKSKA